MQQVLMIISLRVIIIDGQFQTVVSTHITAGHICVFFYQEVHHLTVTILSCQQ